MVSFVFRELSWRIDVPLALLLDCGTRPDWIGHG